MAGNFFQQVKDVANQAVDSTKNAAQKTMLKTKIQSENSRLDKLYTEVGRYYYNINKDNAPEELKQLFANINQVIGGIDALERECRDIEAMEQRANYNRQMGQQQYANNGMGQPYPNGMQQQNMNYNGQPYSNGMQQQYPNGMPAQNMNYNMQPNSAMQSSNTAQQTVASASQSEGETTADSSNQAQ